MAQRPLVRRPRLSSNRCSASCARRCSAAMPTSCCRLHQLLPDKPKCCSKLTMGSCDAAAEHVARSRSTERKSSRMSVKAVLGDSRTHHGASAHRSGAGSDAEGDAEGDATRLQPHGSQQMQ